MENSVSKGPAYKAKMDALDTEIFMLQEKLSKLEAQRKVAQITAHSGEFLYSNIKFAIQYLDQAPPEAQKALLQAMIKSITVFDDYIEMRMRVGQPYDEIACNLPRVAQNNPKDAPKNTSAPQNDCRALVPTTVGLTERPKWLPELVNRQNF
jgi:hypothetical protein